MAQLIVRNLEDDVRDRLRLLASKNQRSMEEEVREILRAAVLRDDRGRDAGLGTQIAGLFRDCPLEDPIEELRGEPARPADLP